jgi:hypothetical protein
MSIVQMRMADKATQNAVDNVAKYSNSYCDKHQTARDAMTEEGCLIGQSDIVTQGSCSKSNARN